MLQWQKFHTDDIIKCLHNQSKYSHFCRAPNVNLFDFLFLLVDYGKVLCSSANKLQQTRMPLLRRIYLQEYWLFCTRFITFTFDLYGLLSFVFVNNNKNNITTTSANQSSWLGSGLILPHQYQISVAKVRRLPCETSLPATSKETCCKLQANPKCDSRVSTLVMGTVRRHSVTGVMPKLCVSRTPSRYGFCAGQKQSFPVQCQRNLNIH